MSLGFWLEVIAPTSVYNGNYTHNVTPMWGKAGVYDALYNSEGKKAWEIIETLKKGYGNMLENPGEYKAMDPSNGWGSYKTALVFLEEVITACEDNPNAIVGISK